MSHVFISYARADGRGYAEQLVNELTRWGIPAWRDTRNLNPYQDFTAEIEKAIESASHVAVCITPDIKRDDSFVRREIGYALGSKKPIIPLLFADILPPIQIYNLTWLNFFNQPWEKAFTQLLERLQQPLSDYKLPTQPDDPFRDYLNSLYQQIVQYLDATVFTLISLHSQATPDAVKPESADLPALLVSFFGQALAMKNVPKLPTFDTSKPFPNISEAFEHYDGRILLLGEPGAGKTTTLMAYARDAVARRLEDPSQPLPVLLRISDWPKNTMPALTEWVKEAINPKLQETFAQIIASGKALLLLDGLDELGSKWQDPNAKGPNPTNETFDPRLRFMQRTPHNNQILVTCRIKDYQEIGEKINLSGAVRLQPLDDPQIEQYLKNYPDLLAAVQADKGLREMVRTPLLLSLFTFAFNGIGKQTKQLRDLQHSPGDLRRQVFETYIKRRYEHEKHRPNANLPYDVETIIKVLGKALLDSTNWNTMVPDELSLRNIEKAFSWTKIESTKLVEQAKHLHLLVPSGDDSFRFIHLLLRDYFIVEPLIAALQKGWYAWRAAEILGEIGDSRAVEPLVAALRYRYTSDFVRKRVAEALGEIGDSRAVEPLIAALRDTDWFVRVRAAAALGKIGDSRAVEPLIAALRDRDEVVRERAAAALGKIGDSRAVEPLIAALHDINSYVRKRAAAALQRFSSG